MAKVSVCPSSAELQRLAAGEVLPPALDILAAHLEGCPQCLARVQTLAPSDTLAECLSQAREQPDGPDAAAVERLIVKLKTAAPKAAEPAPFPCAHCGKVLRAPAGAAGKKVRCPSCGQVIDVPVGAAADRRPLAEAPTRIAGAAAERPPARGDQTVALEPEAVEGEAWDFLAEPQAPDEVGRLGHFRVLEVLGQGGMGVVFRAEDLGLRRSVALKVLRPALSASTSARQRFLREARAAASVKHDHVVTIHTVGEDRGVPFLAMEFLEGEPLDVRLKRDGALPIPDVLRIGREIAEGLAAAHARGLIHRDVKPGNVWLEGARARVKLLDFGLARPAADDTALTQAGMILGTPAYMAPEQGQGRPVDHRCDLFSLGCVLYVLATGQQPFAGTDTVSTIVAIATSEAVPPRSLNPEIPQGLSDLIVRLLAKAPADRPPSAADVAEALAALERPADRPVAAAAGAPRLPRRKLLLAAGGAFLVVAVLAATVLFLPSRNGTIRIEFDDPNTEVVITKTGVRIMGVGGKAEVVVAAGEHSLKIKHGDMELETDAFVLKRGEQVTLRVHLLPGKVQVMRDGHVLGEKDFPGKVAARGSIIETPLRGGIDRLTPSADGKRLFAVFPFEAKAAIIDAASFKTLFEYASRSPAAPLSPSADLRLLAQVDGEGVHFIATQGRDIGRKWLAYPGRTTATTRVVWAPAGDRAFCAFEDGFRLLRADGGKALELGNHPVSRVAWSPDGAWLAAHDGNRVRFWKADGSAGPVVEQVEASAEGGASALRWSPDGKLLACAGKDVTLISPTENAKHALAHKLGADAIALRWQPDGAALLVVSRAGKAAIVARDGSGVLPVPEQADQPRADAAGIGYAGVKDVLLRHGPALHVLEIGDKVRPTATLPARHLANFAVASGGKEVFASYHYPGSGGVLRCYDLQGNLLRTLRGPLAVPAKAATLPPLLAASAFDRLDRKTLGPEQRTFVGNGDANAAPNELVAVLGENAWRVGTPIWLLQFNLDGTQLAVGHGTQLAVGHGTRIVRLDVTTGRRAGVLANLSPNDFAIDRGWTKYARIRSTPGSNSLDVHEVKTGKRLFELGQRARPVFTPDGKYLAAQGFNQPTQFFDAVNGTMLWSAVNGYCPLAFAAEGKELIGYSNPGDISRGYLYRIHDTATGKELRELPAAHVGPVWISPDGKLIAMPEVSRPSTVRIFDTRTAQKVCELEGNNQTQIGAFTPDNATFATVLAEGVRLWDARTGKPGRLFKTSAGCTHLAFSPDGKTLAGGDADGWVRLWDVATGTLKNTSEFHVGPVLTALPGADGATLTTVGGDGTIIAWDVAAGKPAHRVVLDKQLTGAASIQDGARLALQAGTELLLWNLTKKPRQTHAFADAFSHPHGRRLAFDPRGKWLAYTGDPGYVFDLSTEKAQPLLDSRGRTTLAVAPHGALLAEVGGSPPPHPAIVLRDPRSWRPLAHLAESADVAAFHPGGTLLAINSPDRAIRILDLASGSVSRTLEGHRAPVSALAWRGDGRWLASLSAHGTLLVHDLSGAKEVVVSELELREAGRVIRRLAFTPDGRHLVTANANGTAYVFRLAAPPAAGRGK